MTNVIFQNLPHRTVFQRDKALSESKTWEEILLEIHREVRIAGLFQTTLCRTLVLRVPKIRNGLLLNFKKRFCNLSVNKGLNDFYTHSCLVLLNFLLQISKM